MSVDKKGDLRITGWSLNVSWSDGKTDTLLNVHVWDQSYKLYSRRNAKYIILFITQRWRRKDELTKFSNANGREISKYRKLLSLFA